MVSSSITKMLRQRWHIQSKLPDFKKTPAKIFLIPHGTLIVQFLSLTGKAHGKPRECVVSCYVSNYQNDGRHAVMIVGVSKMIRK